MIILSARPLQLFGRAESGPADALIETCRSSGRVQFTGEAKVGNFGSGTPSLQPGWLQGRGWWRLAQQDVGWFQIRVADALGVRMRQTRCHAVGDAQEGCVGVDVVLSHIAEVWETPAQDSNK